MTERDEEQRCAMARARHAAFGEINNRLVKGISPATPTTGDE